MQASKQMSMQASSDEVIISIVPTVTKTDLNDIEVLLAHNWHSCLLHRGSGNGRGKAPVGSTTAGLLVVAVEEAVLGWRRLLLL